MTRAFFLQPFAEREKKPLHVAFERGGNRTRVAGTAIKCATHRSIASLLVALGLLEETSSGSS